MLSPRALKLSKSRDFQERDQGNSPRRVQEPQLDVQRWAQRSHLGNLFQALCAAVQ